MGMNVAGVMANLPTVQVEDGNRHNSSTWFSLCALVV